MKSLFANGKVLLTGEYAVLDGAKALGLPTKHGQYFHIEKTNSNEIAWNSYDVENQIWFSARYRASDFQVISSSDIDKANFVKSLFLASAIQKTPIQYDNGLKLTCTLTFPRNWGLGTSSTLISNFAKWLGLDPFQLLQDTMGGSGYDIGCADSKQPILYRLVDGVANVNSTPFKPSFQNNLFFIYLNQKQNSRNGIASYRQINSGKEKFVSEISQITMDILKTDGQEGFNRLIDLHEDITSNYLQMEKVKDQRFSQFKGSIKSLGAWGGDFCLASSHEGVEYITKYFTGKGYKTVIPYEDLVL